MDDLKLEKFTTTDAVDAGLIESIRRGECSAVTGKMIDKIFNEDCLEGMKRIPDGVIDFVLTDLPFGITNAPFDVRIPFEPMWEQFKRVTKHNAAIALFANGKFLIELAASNIKNYRYKWVWQKNSATGFLNAKKMPLKAHEDILVFYQKLPTYNPQKYQSDPYKTKIKVSTASVNYGKTKNISYVSDGNKFPRDEMFFCTVLAGGGAECPPNAKASRLAGISDKDVYERRGIST